jgi:hypothetical protein
MHRHHSLALLGNFQVGNHLSVIDRHPGQPVEIRSTGHQHAGVTTMKKIFLAVALVVAFAAPAMAEQFPNSYSSR